MSKVIVINDNGQNFKDLEKYGKIVALTKGLVNLSDLRLLSFNIQQKLITIEAGDYLVLTGPTTLSIIVCHYVLSKFNRIKIITFHRKALKYIVQEITSDEIITKEE